MRRPFKTIKQQMVNVVNADIALKTICFGCREWDEDPACTCGTGVICPKHHDKSPVKM